jgi:diguanylate cyclase (GGDEF)-like protein/PAS domain S-box-containing protein
VVADLTERRRMEEALREAHRRLTFHTDNSPIAAVECDPHLRILRWSPGAERTFGWLADEVVGRRVGTDLTLLHPDDEPAVARLVERLLDGRDERNAFYNRNLTKDGRVIHCEWHNSVLRDAHGAVISIFSLALDVTAQAMLQEQLAHQALHDPLTGLPNRASLAGRFRQLLADEEHFAILYLDLDGFKEINDRLGHAAGDELLVVVARRLQRVVRAGDFVVRLGGDEFVVLVEHLRGAAEANALVRRVTAAIEEPIMLGGERVRVGVSVGVAHTTSDLRDPEALLNAADTAMYRVKRAESGFPAAVPPHPDDAAERVRAD